jgi:hypothetical protein
MRLKSINVKGRVRYFFKGIEMKSEPAIAVEKLENAVIVKLDKTNEMLSFIKQGNWWLWKEHASPNSLLYGTKFVME